MSYSVTYSCSICGQFIRWEKDYYPARFHSYEECPECWQVQKPNRHVEKLNDLGSANTIKS